MPRYLLPAEQIIANLDNDLAGKKIAKILDTFSAQIHPVLVPSIRPGDKDITDYVRAGGNLWQWSSYHLNRIEGARNRCQQK